MKLQITTLQPILKEIKEVAGALWDKGWAERNAGNLSVNVTSSIKPMDYISDRKREALILPGTYPGLAGQSLLLTTTGSRMRNLARKPDKGLILIRIGEKGDVCYPIPFANGGFAKAPTSELPTHLAVHEYLKISGSKFNTLIHSHVTEFIVLGQYPETKEKKNIYKALPGMHPETVVFLPEGIGSIPFTLPGTKDIAEKTVSALKKHRAVIWEKHGGLALGTSPADAFDNLDIAAKAASIYLKCLEAGFVPEGLSAEKMEAIRKACEGMF